MAPFTGSPRAFGKVVSVLRREGAAAVRRGRPWNLPPEDQAPLVAAYWRTNLTICQLVSLFGVSKSAAARIIDHLGPMLAVQPRKRSAKDTVLIVDGTLVHTRDHTIAAQTKTTHVAGGQLGGCWRDVQPQWSEAMGLTCRSQPTASPRVIRRTPERTEHAGRWR